MATISCRSCESFPSRSLADRRPDKEGMKKQSNNGFNWGATIISLNQYRFTTRESFLLAPVLVLFSFPNHHHHHRRYNRIFSWRYFSESILEEAVQQRERYTKPGKNCFRPIPKNRRRWPFFVGVG